MKGTVSVDTRPGGTPTVYLHDYRPEMFTEALKTATLTTFNEKTTGEWNSAVFTLNGVEFKFFWDSEICTKTEE